MPAAQLLGSAFGPLTASLIISGHLTELVPVLDELHAATRNLPKWMRPRRVAPTLITLGTTARMLYQGKGRCLIIGPWNYPVSTVLGPLVSAVAAGNTVIVKPSEFTPAVNAVLAEALAEVFDAEDGAVVCGGAATAQVLLACPFDHIFFTGSPAVGKLVMAAAARHLASVTLELGGKSPVIVDDSADLGRAAELIMWGKLLSPGRALRGADAADQRRAGRRAGAGGNLRPGAAGVPVRHHRRGARPHQRPFQAAGAVPVEHPAASTSSGC